MYRDILSKRMRCSDLDSGTNLGGLCTYSLHVDMASGTPVELVEIYRAIKRYDGIVTGTNPPSVILTPYGAAKVHEEFSRVVKLEMKE